MLSSSPSSPVITVGDLKSHLEKQRISPEKFAERAQLSHMTIRRWLKRDVTEVIPEKYYPSLRRLFISENKLNTSLPGSFTAKTLMSEIEKSGKEFTDVKKLQADLKNKFELVRVDKVIFDYAKILMTAIKSPKTKYKKKALAIGALIYFISPIDLIPDHIPVVGYLDDLAVLSLAVNALRSSDTEETI